MIREEWKNQKCWMIDSCPYKTAVCNVRLPDEGCHIYNSFYNLIKEDEIARRDPSEIIRELCVACHFGIILDEDANADLQVKVDEYGEKVVCNKDGTVYDDRGELYEAINRLICALFPNVLGRERWE